MFSAFKSVKKLLFILDKKFIIFLPLLTLFFISGILDLISLGMIAPYINFIIDPDVINNTKFEKFMPFKITDENKSNIFIYFSLSLILIFFLKTLFSILIRALINRFALKNLENLQVRLVSAYQNMNYSDFIKRNTTEYIRNVRELSAECTLCLDLGLRIASELIVLIAIVILIMSIRQDGKQKFFLLIVFGGALGNLYDRIFFKAVPDFIDLHVGDFHWFIFNIADIFITFGVIMLILWEILPLNKDYEKK